MFLENGWCFQLYNVLFSPVLKLDKSQLAIVVQMGWNHQFESMSGIKWKTEFFDAYLEMLERCLLGTQSG